MAIEETPLATVKTTLAKSMTARDLMTSEILVVAEDMTLAELAEFLVGHEISGTVVCDQQGKSSGVVSLTDIATAEAEGGQSLGAERPSYYDLGWDDSAAYRLTDEWDSIAIRVPRGELRVRDIMSPKILSVPPETSAADVARIMLESHIHRVLVEDQGQLLGIVTTSDLLRLLATP